MNQEEFLTCLDDDRADWALAIIGDVIRHQDKWVRSPEQWQKDDAISAPREHQMHLIHHLFNRYPTPPFLDEVWHRYRGTELVAWYVAVARGDSLYRSYMHEFMTRREMHAYLYGPESRSCPRNRIFLAKAICAGTSIEVAHLIDSIGRHHLSTVDYREPFWSEVAKFLAREFTTMFTDANNRVASVRERYHEVLDFLRDFSHEFGDIIDFLSYSHSTDPHFALKGRRLSSIRKASDRWHRRAHEEDPSSNRVTWPGADLDDWTSSIMSVSGRPTRYVIRQLKSSDELWKEGRVMRHCVGHYASRCGRGKTFIWSMREVDLQTRKQIPCLTIEMDSQCQIVQARGRGNRRPTAHEKSILMRWQSSLSPPPDRPQAMHMRERHEAKEFKVRISLAA